MEYNLVTLSSHRRMQMEMISFKARRANDKNSMYRLHIQLQSFALSFWNDESMKVIDGEAR